jgi:hypothetical protein
MGRARSKPAPAPSWEIPSIELTAAQKKAARERLLKDVDQARRDGVYQKLRALRGKLHIDLDLEELRKDRD